MSRSGLSAARLERMREVMSGYVQRREIPGSVLAISRKGEVTVQVAGSLAFGGTEPMRRDSLFRIASMTKPITAVASMILVEECRLRLDDPVDRLLPELADRRVLATLGGALDETTPAKRSISLRDLLTLRMGLGAILTPGPSPIREAMAALGLSPGPNAPSIPADEWMARLGKLPLAHQPGEGWLYHTGSEVLGVLIERATGQSLEAFFNERIFGPLGMKDTGFHVPEANLPRLSTSYRPGGGAADELVVHDHPDDSRWTLPVAFFSGGAGLVSTADDLLAFQQMLLNGGKVGGERILSRPSVQLMTCDHLSAAEREMAAGILPEGYGWGFGLSVLTRRHDLAGAPGRFGWDGGIGTSGYMDPEEELSGVLLTQCMLDAPAMPGLFADFWTSVYQAIDDDGFTWRSPAWPPGGRR